MDAPCTEAVLFAPGQFYAGITASTTGAATATRTAVPLARSAADR
ncbi:hypothetical protein [Nocardia beijingensis]